MHKFSLKAFKKIYMYVFCLSVFIIFIIKDDSEHVPGRLVSGVCHGDAERPAASCSDQSWRAKRRPNAALVRDSGWQQSVGHWGNVLLSYSPTFRESKRQNMETSVGLFENIVSHSHVSHLGDAGSRRPGLHTVHSYLYLCEL